MQSPRTLLFAGPDGSPVVVSAANPLPVQITGGSAGEFLASTVAHADAIPLADSMSSNITSLTLSAGEWDVSGQVNFQLIGTSSTRLIGGSSDASAALDVNTTYASIIAELAAITVNASYPIPERRFSLSAPATIYLIAQAQFSAGVVNGYGRLEARRALVGGGMENPMTAKGDLIVGDTGGAPLRLPIGTNGQVLTSNGTTAAWAPGGSGDSMLEAGSGLSSIQTVGTRLPGTITVTNGSAAITGIGTAFTGIAAQHVQYMTGIVVVDSAGGVYYITGLTVVDDTHATITAATLGASAGPAPASTFQGVSGTYSYYLLFSNAAGDGSTAIGINAAALGLSSTAYGQSATAIPNNLANGEALALGDFALAKGDWAVAVGPDTVADGDTASAFGEFVNAVGNGACALGSNFTNDTPNSVGQGSEALFTLATADRFEVKNPSGGASDVVICSPDGTRWKITVNNAGVLSASAA